MDLEDNISQETSLVSVSSGSDSARGDSNDSSGSFNSTRNTLLHSLTHTHRLRTAPSYNKNKKDIGSYKNGRSTSSRKIQDKGSSIDNLRSTVTYNQGNEINIQIVRSAVFDNANIHKKNRGIDNERGTSSQKQFIHGNYSRSHLSKHRGCKHPRDSELVDDVNSQYFNRLSDSSQRSRLGSDPGVLIHTPEADHSVQNIMPGDVIPELCEAGSMTFNVELDYISGSECLAPPQPHLMPEVRQTTTSHNRTSADSLNLNRRQLPPVPSQTCSDSSGYTSYDQPAEPVKRVRRREPRHSLHARRSLILITMLSILLSLASVGFLVLLINTPVSNNKVFHGQYESCVECLENFDYIHLLTIKKENNKSFCCATLDDQMYALVLMVRIFLLMSHFILHNDW